MEIINISKHGIESGLEGAVIAIGNFDGVHIGHAEIIKMVIERAKMLKKPAGILTFEPHPATFFSPALKNFRLTPFGVKMDILESLGLDFVAYADFNEVFSKLSADDFIKKILVDKLKISKVLTGDDFIFGHNRGGNSVVLEKASKQYGFKYTVVHEIKCDADKRISSSRARELIKNGKVEEVAEVLGRNYIIKGEVVKGASKGKTIGFATANVGLGEFVIPKFGVYKVAINLEGKELKGIANIGVKPTFGDNKPMLEVHIFDFNNDIYGKTISVELIRFIRDEKKFNSVEELKKQIEEDVRQVRT